MRKTRIALVLLFALGVALPAKAAAPHPHEIGAFGVWDAAYFNDDNGNKVCYMATVASSTRSSKPLKGRSEMRFFITHWPADNEKNAVTFSSGYPFKLGSKVTITIAGKAYTLSTGGKGTDAEADMAWMDGDAQEDALVEDIRRSDSLVLKGTSGRGTEITDTFSLKGSADAYKAISKECGI